MQREPNVKKDGLVVALGGVNSSVAPELLERNELAFAINTTVRGGYPATRPRFSIKNWTFADTEQEAWVKTHPLQGYTRTGYRTPYGKTLIVAQYGGRVFTISPDDDFAVVEITPIRSTTTSALFVVPDVDASVAITMTDSAGIYAGYPIYVNGAVFIVTDVTGNIVTATNVTGDPTENIAGGTTVTFLNPNIPSLPLAWMEQAEQYLIIQNGSDAAIIFDGTLARRAVGTEVPTGTAMCYNEEIGRLCVAVNGNEIAIGDVVGGPTEVIDFTETGYLNEGGRFRVPLKYGKITAMSMIANLDRSNGQGPMIVFAEEGFSTFNLPPNREQWKNLTYPVQINMPIRYSATSQNSVVLVNGDVYYRRKDGLGSFVYALREFQGVGNTPISTEMKRVTDKDTESLLSHAAGILFDNRIVFTVNPSGSDNGVYHRGMGVLDLDLISRLKGKQPPAYDGVWTGVRPTGMMTGQFSMTERAFIFALNPDPYDNINELWELHKEVGYDNDANRINSSIESRSFNFGNSFEMKRLQGLEIWVDSVAGNVDIGAQWRPDAYPCWFSFCTEKHLCVTDMGCPPQEDLTCKALVTYNPGYRTRLNFGAPPTDCETLDNKPIDLGYEFQFRLFWTGQLRIRRILARSQDITEEVFPPVDLDNEECAPTISADEDADGGGGGGNGGEDTIEDEITIPNGWEGLYYEVELGPAECSYSLESGTLPPGLTIIGNTIAGTLEDGAAGDWDFVVRQEC